MKIDQKTLSERSWAIPAISGMLTLHHDFKMPRLAKVTRLAWHEGAVDVHMQYGVCNISGNVMSSFDIVVSLHKGGTIEINVPTTATTSPSTELLTFLAGEIFREALRWGDDLAAWSEEEFVETDRASILSMVSAVVGYPLSSVDLDVEKDVANPACLRKIRMLGEFIDIGVTPAGLYGASLYVKGSGPYANILRLYQEHGLRNPEKTSKNPCVRFLKGASFGARKLMYLPLGMVLYFCEKFPAPAEPEADAEDYVQASIVDSRAGESLSALSS